MVDTPEWLPIKEEYIEADVIRWTEAIWSDKKRGRGKHARHVLIGKQRVTGQITNIDNDYIHIKIIEAELIEEAGAKPDKLRQVDSIIRKKPSSLTKGDLERLLWSDEASRASLILEKYHQD